MTPTTAPADLTAGLASALDRAVAAGSPEAITHAVKDVLEERLGGAGLRLDEPFRAPHPTRYARRLLHRHPEGLYSAIVMVWGPGQGTMLHDHAGIWCVEGVVEGRIEVVQYDLVEERGERFRFARQGTIHAGPGEAGALIPPFEYHTIRNAVPDAPSITLHVYGGDMDHCGVFAPHAAVAGDAGGAAGDWYRREERALAFD